MDKQIKVVIGANYGDEGKGLVSWCLAKKAAKENRKILTVLFNGGAQRGHTTGMGGIVHGIGAGYSFGSDAYYHEKFMVDPIAIWLERGLGIIYIHPDCRVVLPCDVIANQKREIERGIEHRHGSCGMGIFEACKRSNIPAYRVTAKDLWDYQKLDEKLVPIMERYDTMRNSHKVYNWNNFFHAVEYMKNHCELHFLDSLLKELDYDTVIFEGGQGLLLDQRNMDAFPHLTPSCTGIYNIQDDILSFGVRPEIYYVSRSYLTRHGNGPMESECRPQCICTKERMTDKTNVLNAWQGELRYGYLDQDKLIRRVKEDCESVAERVDVNLVYTHLNYTNGKLATGRWKTQEIVKPEFVKNVYGSDRTDQMDILL